MGYIRDNAFEGDDMEGVMDLSEIEDMLNKLFEENGQLKFENETLKSNYQKEIQSSIDFCNAYSKTNSELLEEIEKLEQKIKDKNTYQRVLEAKIRRLKDRIKVLEKNGVEPRL